MVLVLAMVMGGTAHAGQPGEGNVVSSIDVRVTTDKEARDPMYGGIGGSVAAALGKDSKLPAVELRGDLQFNRLPPKEIAEFMLDSVGSDMGIDDVTYSRMRSRWSLAASWGATSRERGWRVRVGPEFLIEGDVGAVGRLEPIGWSPDYTAATRAGLGGAVGYALPFGSDVGDPLLDVRVAGSVLAPLSAGGGTVGAEDFEFLEVSGTEFLPVDLLGAESRAWGEATLTVKRLRLGATFGLHHRARSAYMQALSESPDHDVLASPNPVEFLGQASVGVVF